MYIFKADGFPITLSYFPKFRDSFWQGCVYWNYPTSYHLYRLNLYYNIMLLLLYDLKTIIDAYSIATRDWGIKMEMAQKEEIQNLCPIIMKLAVKVK